VPRSALHQIIGRQPDAHALVASLVQALGVPVAIEDAQGRLLHGEAATVPVAGRFPIRRGETPLGWVAGPEAARTIAALLEHLARSDGERKALGAEVLHLYREINLIYSFSEQLAELLDVERVAALTLREARHLIAASDGAVMLLDETDALVTVSAFGDQFLGLTGLRRGIGIIGAIVASATGEIVNEVQQDPRRVAASSALRSLIGAPMKVGERVIGLIVLGTSGMQTYAAADLKLLTTLALQAATAIENARLFERTIQAARERERLLALHQEAELARAKLEGEMALAARIQAELFPSELPVPAGYELAARNRPARRCGGDYYDVLPVTASAGEDGLLLCVADVSGKGLPAALLMSNMQATLRALLGRVDRLPMLAGHASDLLYAATPPEKYVTAALLELQPSSGGLRFVGAGHLDNVILRRDGTIVPLSSTGAPLGLLPPGRPYDETTESLCEGDAIVLYSDGVTDAQDASGEEFGEARVHDVLRASAGQPAQAMLERVFEAVEVFVTGTPQFDDMTMLVARRRGESS
jgi:serine phosphatase RsbU (regulator of sigma subunit)